MAADPVSDKSGFLCTYMSTHPDTLVAYVKHFGKVDGHVTSAKMRSINSKVRQKTGAEAGGVKRVDRRKLKITITRREWTWSTR